MAQHTISLREGEDFIRLGQALKKAGVVMSGAEAKELIAFGGVSVNGEEETRRGRKLVSGDIVTVEGERFQIAP